MRNTVRAYRFAAQTSNTCLLMSISKREKAEVFYSLDSARSRIAVLENIGAKLLSKCRDFHLRYRW
jgi:hypothetical protein